MYPPHFFKVMKKTLEAHLVKTTSSELNCTSPLANDIAKHEATKRKVKDERTFHRSDPFRRKIHFQRGAVQSVYPFFPLSPSFPFFPPCFPLFSFSPFFSSSSQHQAAAPQEPLAGRVLRLAVDDVDAAAHHRLAIHKNFAESGRLRPSGAACAKKGGIWAHAAAAGTGTDP